MDLIPLAMAAEALPLPPGVQDAAQKVVAEGGLLGAACILLAGAGCVLLWLLLRHRRDAGDREGALIKSHEAREAQLLDQIEALHEKRFADMRQVLDALNGNTGALNVISQTQTDRAASTRDMGELLREVVTLARANSDVLKAILACAQANGAAIEKLLWHGGTARASLPPGGA